MRFVLRISLAATEFRFQLRHGQLRPWRAGQSNTDAAAYSTSTLHMPALDCRLRLCPSWRRVARFLETSVGQLAVEGELPTPLL
jgi:hypothetical protein